MESLGHDSVEGRLDVLGCNAEDIVEIREITAHHDVIALLDGFSVGNGGADLLNKCDGYMVNIEEFFDCFTDRGMNPIEISILFATAESREARINGALDDFAVLLDSCERKRPFDEEEARILIVNDLRGVYNIGLYGWL